MNCIVWDDVIWLKVVALLSGWKLFHVFLKSCKNATSYLLYLYRPVILVTVIQEGSKKSLEFCCLGWCHSFKSGSNITRVEIHSWINHFSLLKEQSSLFFLKLEFNTIDNKIIYLILNMNWVACSDAILSKVVAPLLGWKNYISTNFPKAARMLQLSCFTSIYWSFWWHSSWKHPIRL
jgi:hypothetical protein